MKITKFLIDGHLRYRIVDDRNPEVIINDAQGHGFKTEEKALAFLYRRKEGLGSESKTLPSMSFPLF